jgi:hypothetical protein
MKMLYQHLNAKIACQDFTHIQEAINALCARQESTLIDKLIAYHVLQAIIQMLQQHQIFQPACHVQKVNLIQWMDPLL